MNGGENMAVAMAITILAAFIWGTTNHIDKFLLNGIDESASSIKTLLVFSTLVAGLVISPIWLIICKFSISINTISLVSVFMSSFMSILGIYFYLMALDKNDASVIIYVIKTVKKYQQEPRHSALHR